MDMRIFGVGLVDTLDRIGPVDITYSSIFGVGSVDTLDTRIFTAGAQDTMDGHQYILGLSS
jgi:hypothetical protein